MISRILRRMRQEKWQDDDRLDFSKMGIVGAWFIIMFIGLLVRQNSLMMSNSLFAFATTLCVALIVTDLNRYRVGVFFLRQKLRFRKFLHRREYNRSDVVDLIDQAIALSKQRFSIDMLEERQKLYKDVKELAKLVDDLDFKLATSETVTYTSDEADAIKRGLEEKQRLHQQALQQLDKDIKPQLTTE